MHTQLLLADSMADVMTHYPLYFFVPFVPSIRDALKLSSARIYSDFANGFEKWIRAKTVKLLFSVELVSFSIKAGISHS